MSRIPKPDSDETETEKSNVIPYKQATTLAETDWLSALTVGTDFVAYDVWDKLPIYLERYTKTYDLGGIVGLSQDAEDGSEHNFVVNSLNFSKRYKLERIIYEPQ